MSYQVTARKWRPMVFEDVVGQSHITNTLVNAITTKRVAHAFIFSGQRGCGKTTTARILARALNCESPRGANPDNTCSVCRDIIDGRSLDVIEIDGASNRGVEEIRNLRDAVRYPPVRGKFKVYIIDEVHMLTKEAFNALLKTLEEPPPHVIFIFATTEIHKVPATILSRCQRFDFRRIAVDEITTRLKFIAAEEGVTIDDEALITIARKGDGSLRDAQSLFDQVRSFCGNSIGMDDVRQVLRVIDLELFFRVTDLVKAGDVRGAVDFVDEIVRSGIDLREFLIGLSEHFRNILVVRTTESSRLVEASEHHRQRYEKEAARFEDNDLLRLLKLTGDLEQALRWVSQPRYKFEAGLLQMIKMNSAAGVEELLREIHDLKKKLDAGTLALEKKGNGSDVVKEEGATVGVKVVGAVSAGALHTPAAMPMGVHYLRQKVLADRANLSQPAYHELARPNNSPPTNPDVLEQTVEPDGRSGITGYAGPRGEAFSVKAPRSFGENGAEVDYTSGGVVAPGGARVSEARAPALQVISAEEAYARWQDWVSEVRQLRISVGTVLGQTSLLDVSNGAVRIACPDDYHLSYLRRNREFLIESFRKVTGCSVRIEPVLQTQPAAAPSKRPAKVVEQQRSSPPTNGSTSEGDRRDVPASDAVPAESPASLDDHPVIKALKRELGAELIE